jgi:hypothetical protein
VTWRRVPAGCHGIRGEKARVRPRRYRRTNESQNTSRHVVAPAPWAPRRAARELRGVQLDFVLFVSVVGQAASLPFFASERSGACWAMRPLRERSTCEWPCGPRGASGATRADWASWQLAPRAEGCTPRIRVQPFVGGHTSDAVHAGHAGSAPFVVPRGASCQLAIRRVGEDRCVLGDAAALGAVDGRVAVRNEGRVRCDASGLGKLAACPTEDRRRFPCVPTDRTMHPSGGDRPLRHCVSRGFRGTSGERAG